MHLNGKLNSEFCETFQIKKKLSKIENNFDFFQKILFSRKLLIFRLIFYMLLKWFIVFNLFIFKYFFKKTKFDSVNFKIAFLSYIQNMRHIQN